MRRKPAYHINNTNIDELTEHHKKDKGAPQAKRDHARVLVACAHCGDVMRDYVLSRHFKRRDHYGK